MSIKVMTMVFDRYPVGGNERLLALAMADHARDDGTRIWPSIAELARKTLQSESTVRRQIKHMVARCWLEPVRKASGRPGDTNEYRIHPGWIGGAALPSMGDEPGEQGGQGDEVTGVNLTPVMPDVETPEAVHKVIHTGVNLTETGVKTGETGVTAMTPESSGTIKNLYTPLPPVDTGGCGQSPKPKPQKPAGKAHGLGAGQAGQGGQREATPWRWHQSRSGIEREGQRLGLGCWDEAGFQAGRGEAFAAYERRVLRAWEVERAAGQAQAAGGRQGAGA